MNKVPFALLKDTYQYVDVHEVDRGTKCDCICPSCKTPLSARQGDVNAWHFAHATRATSEKTSKDCEFSFYVSVTQMAKQLFAEEGHVQLGVPEYTYLVEDRHPLHKCRITKEVTITSATYVGLEGIEIESKIAQHPGDVVGRVKGFPLIIGLSHKEKAYQHDPHLLDKFRAGIIEIDLTHTWEILFEQKCRGAETFRMILKDYLFTEVEHKKWLYHPRQESIIEKARETLLQEPLYVSVGTAVSRRKESSEGDFIDRALAGFSLNKR
jgi:hypothetical protein